MMIAKIFFINNIRHYHYYHRYYSYCYNNIFCCSNKTLKRYNPQQQQQQKQRYQGQRMSSTSTTTTTSSTTTTSASITTAAAATEMNQQQQHHLPVITVFTSIANIVPSLRQAVAASSSLSSLSSIIIEEVIDTNALSGYGGTVEFQASKLQPTTIDQLTRAEILITEPIVLAKILQIMELPNLKWCQSTYAGVDPMFPLSQFQFYNNNNKNNNNNDMDDNNDDSTIRIPKFALTRFAGTFGPPIAEWCLGRIISHERNFDLSRQDQILRQEWGGSKQVLQYRYLSELTLSILGCGDIGMCIAKSAKYGFGMRVVGYSKSLKQTSTTTATTGSSSFSSSPLDESTTSLEYALQQADYIVSVLPSTEQTKGLLTESIFEQNTKQNKKPPPVFINVGRGSVTTTKDIIASLDKGYLSAAILDVVEEEPLPKTNPLWAHPKVTISPHVSGLTRGQDVPNLVLDNYQRYIQQQPLLYQVDWKKKY